MRKQDPIRATGTWMAERKSSKFENGQSLAEFALTLVAVLILLAGLVDLSRAFFIYMALHDAAQEGAVYGSIDPANVTEIEARVRATAQHPIDLSNLMDVSITVEYPNGNTYASVDGSNGIQVTVSYDSFVLTMPFLGSSIGSQTFALNAMAIDTILRPAC